MADSNRGLHFFAKAVACCTYLLVFAGGLVTSTGSGLSVPDWPLSFGQVFPRMEGGVVYEHSHRLIAATIGMLTIALALWLWRSETRKWVRRLGEIALLAVICQGVLGGITVLFLLPTPVSVGHAGLAQVFLCLTVSIATFTSPRWKDMQPHIEETRSPSLRVMTAATTVVIYLQILVGALMRHTSSGLAIPDFPLSFGRLAPDHFTRQIAVNYAHRLGAIVAAGFILWVVVRILRCHGSEKTLRGPALLLANAFTLQIFLGAMTVWSAKGTLPTTIHVLGGSILLTTSLYLTLVSHRVLLPQSRSHAIEAAPANAAKE